MTPREKRKQVLDRIEAIIKEADYMAFVIVADEDGEGGINIFNPSWSAIKEVKVDTKNHQATIVERQEWKRSERVESLEDWQARTTLVLSRIAARLNEQAEAQSLLCMIAAGTFHALSSKLIELIPPSLIERIKAAHQINSESPEEETIQGN